ncbi:MAG: nucleotidyltransferase family protein [candidate division WOR-3 bacterium]
MEKVPLDSEKRQALKRVIAARNIFLLNELRQILDAFHRSKIEVIILKGAALTESLYPHIGIRGFVDIDLLVHPEDMSRVAEIIRSFNYQPEIPGADLGQPWTEKFGCIVDVTYIKQNELTVMVDVHWGLGRPGTYFDRVDIKSLWHRAKKEKVAGIDALILCPEDLLIFLCLHMFKHCPNFNFNSLCDIGQLIKFSGSDIDWQDFVNRVFQFRICLPVRFAIQQTCRVFQSPVPVWVLKKFDSYNPGFLERVSFRIGRAPGQRYSTGRYTLSCILIVQGLGRKIGYLRRIFFPDRKFILWRYGNRFNSLPQYYIMHLFRVIIEFGAAISLKRSSPNE